MKLLTSITLLMICITALGQTFHTEYKYPDSKGKEIIIQNSYPKGGLKYTDLSGKEFVYAVFWTRISNNTDSQIELSINFPAESFIVPSSPENYFKLFLPPNTMSLEKEPLFNYGLTGLNYFLNSTLNKPTYLNKTVMPNEACIFYVVTLFKYGVDGVLRTALVLKEQKLYYIISGNEIPCGQIISKE